MKDQLTNDPNFAASIENTGVHDPLFLHETPVADFIILTFEGADPETVKEVLVTIRELAEDCITGAHACHIRGNKSTFVKANVGVPFNSRFTNEFTVLNLSKLD